MNLERLKEKLKKYQKEEIIITPNSELQAFSRDINLEAVKNNIRNPEKLVHAEKQEAKRKDEEKYDCYFSYSKTLCHRYILTINSVLSTHICHPLKTTY